MRLHQLVGWLALPDLSGTSSGPLEVEHAAFLPLDAAFHWMGFD